MDAGELDSNEQAILSQALDDKFQYDSAILDKVIDISSDTHNLSLIRAPEAELTQDQLDERLAILEDVEAQLNLLTQKANDFEDSIENLLSSDRYQSLEIAGLVKVRAERDRNIEMFADHILHGEITLSQSQRADIENFIEASLEAPVENIGLGVAVSSISTLRVIPEFVEINSEFNMELLSMLTDEQLNQ